MIVASCDATGPVGIGCPLASVTVDALLVIVGNAELVRAGKIALAGRVTVVTGESCAKTVARKAETKSEANIISDCVCEFSKRVMTSCRGR